MKKEIAEIVEKVGKLPQHGKFEQVRDAGFWTQIDHLPVADLKAMADHIKGLDGMLVEARRQIGWVLNACTVDRDAKFELEMALATLKQEGTTNDE